MLSPGLVLKSGAFSNGKTVNSIKDLKKIDPFRQINVTNQPSGYSHILIRTPKDLVTLVRDIYYYHLYYNSYEEKRETYDLYKQTLENINTYKFWELFPNALNIKKHPSKWKNLKTRIGIYFGSVLSCNLYGEQLKKEIESLERYFQERKKFTDIYGEDLILDYFIAMSLDELHLYFGARNFKKNFSGGNEFLMEFVAFPVKLNTRIEGIVQNVFSLDIVFRRQASVYKRHISRFAGLIQRTEEYEVKNSENPQYDESEITSTKSRINFYKIFGKPKIQYYRKHLIRPDEPNVYEEGMFLRHIKYMSDSFFEMQEKHKKAAKKQLQELNDIPENKQK